MTNTLYLKYRPQKISELDLTEVRERLAKIVKSGKISHAFLFAGPRGAGKTSAARILAKIVNCEEGGGEPCNSCRHCEEINRGASLDIIEIDAASHGLVEDARSIREAAKLSTAGAKKKVYIIDEAHMLTQAAANALLKILEEPPAHVMFILATTAPEKLPDTVRSRCTTLVFRKALPAEVVRSLERPASGEKLKVEKGVLEEIAQNVDGSFREAHKLLEQLSLAGGEITIGETKKLVALSGVDVARLLEPLARRDTKLALAEVDRVVKSGANLKMYTAEVIGTLRRMLLAEMGIVETPLRQGFEGQGDIKALIELFSEAAGKLTTAVIPQLPLELAVVRWCEQERTENRGQKTEKNPSSKLEQHWREIMRQVKPRNHSIEALLRATRPVEFDGKTLRLEVFYAFHKDRLEKDEYRKIVEEVAAGVLGTTVHLVCVLSGSRQKAQDLVNIEPEVEDDIVRAAEEIFGQPKDAN